MTIDLPKTLNNTKVRGFLLDITGVLYNSGGEGRCGVVIPKSVEAVKRLFSGYKLAFVTNESTGTVEHVVNKLRRLGYTLEASDIVTPAPVAAAYVRQHSLRPHLLLHPGIRSYFCDMDQSNPNCVVIGDAEEEFTFENVNNAFRALMKMEDPLLISLGCGKFYQRTDGPTIDVGAYAKALQFASGCRHVIIGKPSAEYFQYALDKIGTKKEETVMIGDDIVSDVGGAIKFGMRGVQVRTGKWRPEWENHEIKPTHIADDLYSAVDTVINEYNK